MRRIRIWLNETPYYEKELKKENIPYRYEQKHNKVLFYVDAGRGEAERLYLEAKCKKQRDDTDAKVPVYSIRTLGGPMLRKMIKKYGNAFHVLRQHKKAFEKYM